MLSYVKVSEQREDANAALAELPGPPLDEWEGE